MDELLEDLLRALHAYNEARQPGSMIGFAEQDTRGKAVGDALNTYLEVQVREIIAQVRREETDIEVQKILNSSDEDMLGWAKSVGIDPEVNARQMRALIETVINRLRQ